MRHISPWKRFVESLQVNLEPKFQTNTLENVHGLSQMMMLPNQTMNSTALSYHASISGSDK